MIPQISRVIIHSFFFMRSTHNFDAMHTHMLLDKRNGKVWDQPKGGALARKSKTKSKTHKI